MLTKKGPLGFTYFNSILFRIPVLNLFVPFISSNTEHLLWSQVSAFLNNIGIVNALVLALVVTFHSAVSFQEIQSADIRFDVGYRGTHNEVYNQPQVLATPWDGNTCTDKLAIVEDHTGQVDKYGFEFDPEKFGNQSVLVKYTVGYNYNQGLLDDYTIDKSSPACNETNMPMNNNPSVLNRSLCPPADPNNPGSSATIVLADDNMVPTDGTFCGGSVICSTGSYFDEAGTEVTCQIGEDLTGKCGVPCFNARAIDQDGTLVSGNYAKWWYTMRGGEDGGDEWKRSIAEHFNAYCILSTALLLTALLATVSILAFAPQNVFIREGNVSSWSNNIVLATYMFWIRIFILVVLVLTVIGVVVFFITIEYVVFIKYSDHYVLEHSETPMAPRLSFTVDSPYAYTFDLILVIIYAPVAILVLVISKAQHSAYTFPLRPYGSKYELDSETPRGKCTPGGWVGQYLFCCFTTSELRAEPDQYYLDIDEAKRYRLALEGQWMKMHQTDSTDSKADLYEVLISPLDMVFEKGKNKFWLDSCNVKDEETGKFVKQLETEKNWRDNEGELMQMTGVAYRRAMREIVNYTEEKYTNKKEKGNIWTKKDDTSVKYLTSNPDYAAYRARQTTMLARFLTRECKLPSSHMKIGGGPDHIAYDTFLTVAAGIPAMEAELVAEALIDSHIDSEHTLCEMILTDSDKQKMIEHFMDPDSGWDPTVLADLEEEVDWLWKPKVTPSFADNGSAGVSSHPKAPGTLLKFHAIEGGKLEKENAEKKKKETGYNGYNPPPKSTNESNEDYKERVENYENTETVLDRGNIEDLCSWLYDIPGITPGAATAIVDGVLRYKRSAHYIKKISKRELLERHYLTAQVETGMQIGAGRGVGKSIPAGKHNNTIRRITKELSSKLLTAAEENVQDKEELKKAAQKFETDSVFTGRKVGTLKTGQETVDMYDYAKGITDMDGGDKAAFAVVSEQYNEDFMNEEKFKVR